MSRSVVWLMLRYLSYTGDVTLCDAFLRQAMLRHSFTTQMLLKPPQASLSTDMHSYQNGPSSASTNSSWREKCYVINLDNYLREQSKNNLGSGPLVLYSSGVAFKSALKSSLDGLWLWNASWCGLVEKKADSQTQCSRILSQPLWK